MTGHLPEQPPNHEPQSIPGAVLDSAKTLISPKPVIAIRCDGYRGFLYERPELKSLFNEYMCFIKVLGS